MAVTKDGDELILSCSTCGKTWTRDFQYFIQTDAAGNVIDRGIIQQSNMERIGCNALDGANRRKKNDFVSIRKR
jgi:hypothetical protein